MKATKLSERYALEDRIASGGMGAVYCATDERLGRRVAVKLLREELADDPRFVERFRREARAVAALSHPHIASVFDYGEDEEHHYIVMEYVDGRDLARTMREEAPLSPDRAARIAAQSCEALAHAHAAGVVHRDVKPANIIVDTNDRVKVTDFGIARAAGDSTLTATGSVLGTAQYLSPEQASGGKIGPQADIYSLGIVLYEMLTGAIPFAGDSPVAIAMQHISDDMPVPSNINPEVPPALDAVVLRATAKDPRARYADARDMAAALHDAISPTGALATEGATSVLEPDDTTRELTGGVFPIPDRWDTQRLGRGVLLGFGALVLIAALLLLWRVFAGPDEPQGSERRNRGGAVVESTAPTEAAETITIPTDIIGAPADEVEGALQDAGLTTETVDVENEAPGGTVIGSNPEPGTSVSPGDTVTLSVSTGSDHGSPEDPGKSKGHGPKEKDD